MTPSRKIDYLCIGHLTEDLTPEGIYMGGTAAYSTLTAKSFGLSCGLVTSYKSPVLPQEFDQIEAHIQQTPQMVQFENIYEGDHRIQYVRHQTQELDLEHLPAIFTQANIIHGGPILNDFPLEKIKKFQNSLLAITPQGWLRAYDQGRVKKVSWEVLEPILPIVDAVVISQEDVEYDQLAIATIARLSKLLVVTEGFHGSDIYWQGEQRHFHAPVKTEVDPTGAGDIFSSAFFILLQRGYTPWAAGEVATEVASLSVTRKGLSAIPTRSEITEILYQYSTSEKL